MVLSHFIESEQYVTCSDASQPFCMSWMRRYTSRKQNENGRQNEKLPEIGQNRIHLINNSTYAYTHLDLTFAQAAITTVESSHHAAEERGVRVSELKI